MQWKWGPTFHLGSHGSRLLQNNGASLGPAVGALDVPKTVPRKVCRTLLAQYVLATGGTDHFTRAYALSANSACNVFCHSDFHMFVFAVQTTQASPVVNHVLARAGIILVGSLDLVP